MSAAISRLLFVCALAGAMGFSISMADAAKHRTQEVLYSFTGADGQYPLTSVVNIKGVLFGTTAQGGVHNDGTVFSLDPKTHVESVLYSFCIKKNCADGADPGSLIALNGKLYGTTSFGGKHDGGTLFSVNPKTGRETVLYSFCSAKKCTDGSQPFGTNLINFNGSLYGTTRYGGIANGGAVFAVNQISGEENVVYSFCASQDCRDGLQPYANLALANGMLYGTTSLGGTGQCSDQMGPGCGTVYSLDPTTGTHAVLYSFCDDGSCSVPAYPTSLIEEGGIVYGTTLFGGINKCADGCGTVFSINLQTNLETTVYNFCARRNCADGSSPISIIDLKGTLYGISRAGGNPGCDSGDGCGTVFSLNPITSSESVVYSFCNSFNCTDGADPDAGLLNWNGVLYGTTVEGGTGLCHVTPVLGCGTVFALTKR